MKETVKDFLYRYRHGWILSYFLIYLSWFAYLEQTVTRRFHVIHMPVDDYIPFIEVFVIPYFLWFVYVALAIAYFFFTNVQDYYKLCIFLFVGMTVFLVVSTVYPNGHYRKVHPNGIVHMDAGKQVGRRIHHIQSLHHGDKNIVPLKYPGS